MATPLRRRSDRDERTRAGSVEGVARCGPGRAAAEGGRSAVRHHDPSSSTPGAAISRGRRSGPDSSSARSGIESTVADGIAATGAGGVPTLVLGIWPRRKTVADISIAPKVRTFLLRFDRKNGPAPFLI